MIRRRIVLYGIMLTVLAVVATGVIAPATTAEAQAAYNCTTPWGSTVTNLSSVTAYQAPSVTSPSSCTSESQTCFFGKLTGTFQYGSCSVTSTTCTLPWGGTINSGQSRTAYQASSVPFGSSCISQTRSCTNGTLSGTYTNQSCTVASGASCTLPWGGTINSGQSTTAYQASSVPFGSSCTSQSRTCTNGTLSGTYTNQSCTVAGGASCTLPWGGTINSGQSTTAYQASTVPSPTTCASQSQSRTCTNGSLSGSYTYGSCSVVSGGPSATASVGDTVRIAWAATNGWSYSSTYSVDQTDTCGNTGGVNYAWTANTGSGSSDVVIAACQAGRTYTYTYRVTNSAGYQTTSSATITVTAPASCNISFSPTTILRGSNSTMTYSSSNATSGTIAPLPGAVGTSGTYSASPNATTTYSGTFTGPTGSGVCSATLNVQCAPLYSCSGQQIQYTTGGCVTTNVGAACSNPMQCVPGQSTCQPLNVVFNATAGATGHLEANPQLVRKGASSKLFWNVSNVTTCTVTGSNGDSFAGGCASNTCTSGSGGRTTAGISSTVLYTLSCVTGGAPLNETVSVLPSPEYKEQ